MGRDREVVGLRQAVDAALSGKGSLCLLSGDGGIGKTRLLTEVADSAAGRDATVVWGRCWEGAGAPVYWPWVQIARTLAARMDPEVLAQRLGRGAPFVAEVVPEIGERLELSEPSEIGADRARFEFFDAFTRCLTGSSHDAPLIVLLDDLQWSDRASLLLLEFLAREVADHPLLVVGAYRELEAAQREDAAKLGEVARHGSRLLLRGLDPPEVQRLVCDLVGREVSADVAEMIHASTGGNPFFCDELARLLEAEGHLDDAGAGWVGVPEGVRGTIRRRLERLSDHARGVLDAAAVVGRRFSLAVLELIIGRERDSVIAALDEAGRHGLLTAPPALGSHRFDHDLVREAIYEDIAMEQRLLLHRRVGETLVAFYGDNLDAHLAEVAHHFLEAARVGDIDDAVDFATRAGRRALEQLAFEESVEIFGRADDLLEAEGIEDLRRCEALIGLGEAYKGANDFVSAHDALFRAGDLARRLSVPDLLVRAALALRIASGYTFTDMRIVAMVEEAARVVPEDAVTERMIIMSMVTSVSYLTDYDRVVEASEEVIALADRLEDSPSVRQVRLHAERAQLYAHPDLDRTARLDAELLDLTLRKGDRSAEALIRLHGAIHRMRAGDVNAVAEESHAIARLGEELDDPVYRWIPVCLEAMLAILRGDLDEGMKRAEEAVALNPSSVMMYALQQFFVDAIRGRLDQIAATAEPYLEADMPPFVKLLVRSLVAYGFAELGREAEAREHVRALEAFGLEALPRDNLWTLRISMLAEACWLLGDRDRASTCYRLLEPFSGQFVVVGGYGVVCNGSLSYHLGVLASTLGRHDDAVSHLEDALAGNRRVEAWPFVHRTEYALAIELLDRDETDRAAELLRAAHKGATEIGMAILLRRIEEAQGRLPPEGPEPVQAKLRRTGADRFELTWDGTTFGLRATKGLEYIHLLLSQPGEELFCADMEALATGSRSAPAGIAEAGLGTAAARDEPVLDAEAKRAYRERIAAIEDDIAEAEAFNDPERAERARVEREAVVSELARATGLGGRDRPTSSRTERARVNVTRAIRAAVSKIGEVAPELANHLTERVSTGRFCVYEPDPNLPIHWIP